MTWTSERLAEAGHYWHRSKEFPTPTVVFINEMGMITWLGCEDFNDRLADFNPPGLQWAGPILPPPLEAQA